MGKIKKEENKYIKMISEYNINHFTCNDCPAKLFYSEDKPINIGVGNPNSNTMIILPIYISVNELLFNKIIDIINEAYKTKYSVSVCFNIYITPVIKCFCDKLKYDINNVLLNKCAIKTKSEIARFKPTKIIYLGDSKDIDIILEDYNCCKKCINCPCTIFNNYYPKIKEKFINALLTVI